MFADIHNHLLPGVDDGAQTLDDTLRMLDQAIEAGVTSFCLTPHVHGERDEIERIEHLKKVFTNLKEELVQRNYAVEMHLGCEIYCTTQMAELAQKKEFTFGEGKKYLLVELPPTEAPHYFPELMFRVKLEGVTPILAHPERNMALMRKPEILAHYLKIGVLTQVTTGSLSGDFGDEIQEFSRRIVRSNACTVIASDAHNTGRRSFSATKRAYDETAGLIGEYNARKLFADNPRRIIAGEALSLPEYDSESEEKLIARKKKRFFFF